MDKQRRNSQINKVIKNIANIILKEIEEEISEESKRLWVRKWISRRESLGASNGILRELQIEDPSEYFGALRMSSDSFNYLLNKTKSKIQRKNTHLRDAIPAESKLQCVLYFLATGSSLRTLQHLFRLGKSTISEFIPDVCEAIYSSLKDFIQFPDESKWKCIEEGFRKEWNFPGCCGAVDGKHVIIKAPTDSGSLYFNYKGTYSIVLMAVVDHNYCFTYIDVGCNGRISDGGVFRQCNLHSLLENGLLPEGNFLVGDNAFPLKEYLLKPFPGTKLNLKEKIFNYRLSRARRIVENAFGILASRFRIFEKPMPFCPEKVDLIVKACCALHNWLILSKEKNHSVDTENLDAGVVNDGSWRNLHISQGLLPLPRTLSTQSTRKAQELRLKYADYFVGEGSVDWQIRMIH